MAIVKAHEIYGNIKHTINYVTDSYKTDGNKLVHQKSFKNINNPLLLGLQWTMKNNHFSDSNFGKRESQGFHFIQSFAEGEVTYNQAFEIGKQFADQISNDEVEFVLSTHIDKGHIHNHIVFSPRKKDGNKWHVYWKKDLDKFRAISDNLCRKNNLSICNGKNKGVEYLAWQMRQEGNNNREVITKVIDYLIANVDTYENFIKILEKMEYKIFDEEENQDNEESNIFTFNANVKLMKREDETHYFFKLPNTKELVMCDKECVNKISEKTYRVTIPKQEQLSIISIDGTIKRQIKGSDLSNYFEDKTRQKGRKGLRIKSRFDKKVVRCNRLKSEKYDCNLSKENIKKIIEENGVEKMGFFKEILKKREAAKIRRELTKAAGAVPKMTASEYQEKKQNYLDYLEKQRRKKILEASYFRHMTREIKDEGNIRRYRKGLVDKLKEIDQKYEAAQITYQNMIKDNDDGYCSISEIEFEDYITNVLYPIEEERNKIHQRIQIIDTNLQRIEEFYEENPEYKKDRKNYTQVI